MTFWTVLILAAVAAHGSQHNLCPELCSCLLSADEVVCNNNSRTHFPVQNLSPSTTRLSINLPTLSSITADHLSAVPLLKYLQLYHNNLTSLPADLLKGVPNLDTLDLTGNRLVHLPPDIFSHASLRDLLLRNNLFDKVDAEWFPDNSSLTSLDLSGNRLSRVPTALFHRLPNLVALDLSDNRLQQLQPDALNKMPHLETLNVAGNMLKSLEAMTFSHNLKLSKLFLHENQLQGLPASLLQGLRHLEFLLLNKNQLQNLPSGLLDDTSASCLMSLSGNPWVCDDRLEYLWKWLVGHNGNVLFLEEVTCALPEAVKDRKLVSLSGSELGLQSYQ